jgi:polar amino acid transport system substrate-binding protein
MKTLFRTAALGALFVAMASAAYAEKVKVSVAAEPYPPFASKNAAGQWEGFEVDLAAALCKEAKLDCELVETAWDGIIPALTAKKIDAIVASMSITEERQKTIAFSIPYYNTPAMLIAAKETAVDLTAESLKGKTIGVQVSTIHLAFAEKTYKDSTIKVYQTQDEANADLAAGRIDAAIADSAALDAFMASDAGKGIEAKGYYPKDPIDWGTGAGVGIRQEDTALKGQFDEAIKAVYANGTYKTIMDKYFKYDIGTPPK